MIEVRGSKWTNLGRRYWQDFQGDSGSRKGNKAGKLPLEMEEAECVLCGRT